MKRYSRYADIYEIQCLADAGNGRLERTSTLLELTAEGLVAQLIGCLIQPEAGPSLMGWGRHDCESCVVLRRVDCNHQMSVRIGRESWDAAIADMRKRRPEWASKINNV